jgi:hypothetical protein
MRRTGSRGSACAQTRPGTSVAKSTLTQTWLKSDWPPAPSLPICKASKIKFEILSYFSSPENWLFLDHFYHAIHHNFTTNYHHAAPQNPQKPLQNRHSTMSGLISRKTSKNILSSPKF